MALEWRADADHIDTWFGLLRGNDRAIPRAASQMSKAADYLLVSRSSVYRKATNRTVARPKMK